MANPIVIAYHLVWTIYGYWLPNDPRGSTSNVIRNELLEELGQIHHGRKKVQPNRFALREFDRAKECLLEFPVCEFDPEAIGIISRAFDETVSRQRYTCHACAILKDHVHLLIRKHKHSAEQMIANLQCASHLALRDAGKFDLEHPVWGGHGWSVFLDCPDDVWRTIRYIARNLRAPVAYPFVLPYDNWPLHPGHSPNSPYARRLNNRDS